MVKRLIFPLFFLWAIGCSKSPQIQQVEPNVIQEARNYFEKYILVINAVRSARIEGGFAHGNPSWELATTRQLSRGTVVQVPLTVDSVQSVTFQNHVLPLRYKDYLLIYKDRDSVYQNMVMRTIRTGSTKPGYSGLVLLQDWAGNNPHCYAVEGGSLINPSSTSRKTAGNDFDNAIRTCVTINYYYAGNGEPWQYSFSKLYCTGDAGPENPGSNGPGDWQELPPDDGGSGSGSGGTSPAGNLEPPPVILRDIRSSFTSPCLSQALAELSMGSLTNYVAELLKTCYESDKMIDAVFLEAPAADFPTPFHDGKTSGQEAGGGLQDPNRFIALEITINSEIANGSKEYVTATIIHEIIHGYYKILYGRESTDPWDHGQMAGDNYFNKMKFSLMEIFPNMSDVDAQALVWIGLQTTDQYQNKPLAEKNSIESIALNYRAGISGTKCNP